MALDALASLVQGGMQGYDFARGSRDPMAEARLAMEVRRQNELRPYRDAQTRVMQQQADQNDLKIAQQRRAEAQRQFSDFDAMASEMGGYSRALRTPGGQRMFLEAYNSSPDREELGAPEIEGFEPIDEENFDRWGFNREDFDRMRAERGSEALFVPWRTNENGDREPVLEDLDGDGMIDAYGGEEIGQMVRPYFMTGDRAGQEFGALTPEQELGGQISIGQGGGQPRQGGGQPRQGGRSGQPLADVDRIWDNMIQTESRGRQFGDDGQPLASDKGALGIAQVMPDTAPEAARMAGLEWDEERYRNDPEYNEQIGRAYFDNLLERYNGDPVLASAAYNGGMGNVDEWVSEFGDPRTGEISHEEFTRRIPFAETQGYVMKALGGGGEAAAPQGQGAQSGGDSVEQLSRPAVQSAVDVATGHDPNRVPSLIERASSGGSGPEVDPTSWLERGWNAARDGVDTAVEYTIGTDAKEAADDVADRYVNQPLSGLARNAGRVIRAGGETATGVTNRGIGAAASAGSRAAGADTDEARETGDRVTRSLDETTGLRAPAEEPAEEEQQPVRHETNLGRRIGEDRGFGPGSAKRAASNDEVLADVRDNTTPEQEASAGQQLMSNLQQTGDTTYSVTSSSGKPSHKDIGHAYTMMARGLIDRDEFTRFVDTGTISADGVQLIQTGMQQAAQTAREQISQTGQTQRNAQENWSEVQRERAKQGGDRDNAVDFVNDANTLGPSTFGVSQEDWEGDFGNRVTGELQNGIWRMRHEVLGTPNDTHSLLQGHQVLTEMEDKVNPKWWEWYDKIFKGERSHNLSADPSMQALAAMDTGLFANEDNARRTVRSLERYRETMNSDPELRQFSRDPRVEAQALVNFHRLAKMYGDEVDLDNPGSEAYDAAMDTAIRTATGPMTLDQLLQDGQ